MRRNVQILLLLLSGAGLLHIALFSEVYLRFVKEGLRPLLIVSGVLLVALGTVSAARDGFPFAKPSTRPARTDEGHADEHGHPEGHGQTERHGHAEGHGHDHSRGPRVAWLLFFPALSLLFFTPPALGSYTAARDGDPAADAKNTRFAPLPSASPLVMPLSDFSSRARRDGARSLEGRTVSMTGFVTPGQGGGWYLTRLSLSCCAADSQAIKVRVHGAPPPATDTWVTVTGTWRPVGTVGTPSAAAALDANGVQRTARPANPYADAPPPRA
ncbi:TIGR03943 family protein [Streptomyces sp. NPDC047108]|uniref:TIGR03943 family putative permease subunit n=1 Tax=Streptomyces sp. NPDC047108 TaxID=3155025 RepID=UPI0033F94BD1